MSTTTCPVLPEEVFSRMTATDGGLREAAHPVPCCRADGEIVYRRVRDPFTGTDYAISEDQKERARHAFELRRQALLQAAAVPGTLTFVTMGCDYATTLEDGVGNHRIRCYLTDADGHTRFVELHPRRDRRSCEPDETLGFWGETADVTYNLSETERVRREWEALIAEYGSRNRVPAACRPRPADQRYSSVDEPSRPFTRASILAFVNETFGGGYHHIRIDRHILDPDAFVCRRAEEASKAA